MMERSDFYSSIEVEESDSFTYFNELIQKYEEYKQELKEEMRKEIIQEIDNLRIKLSTPNDFIRREEIFPQIYQKDELDWLTNEDAT